MPYIGKTPTVGNFQVCDAISVVNGQAAYTLQVGGVNVAPESANHMLVSLNGILQKPGSSFTISGSTMTFASNLATGDVIDFVQILGNVLDIGQPSDDTVTAAKLNDNVISGQTELAATPADTDELLISDAGTIKRIDFSHLKTGITEADVWRITASFTGTAEPVTSNWERADDATSGRLGTGMTESSGIFTFPSTGIWRVSMFRNIYGNNETDRGAKTNIDVSSDSGSNYDLVSFSFCNTHSDESVGFVHSSSVASAFVDVTNASNFRVRFDLVHINANAATYGDSGANLTWAEFVRLGDT